MGGSNSGIEGGGGGGVLVDGVGPIRGTGYYGTHGEGYGGGGGYSGDGDGYNGVIILDFMG